MCSYSTGEWTARSALFTIMRAVSAISDRPGYPGHYDWFVRGEKVLVEGIKRLLQALKESDALDVIYITLHVKYTINRTCKISTRDTNLYFRV